MPSDTRTKPRNDAAFKANFRSLLTASDVVGAVNVASGIPHSIGSIATKIATILHRQDLLETGALPDRPNEVRFMVADTTRLRDEVGFKKVAPLAADLKRIIELTLQEMKG